MSETKTINKQELASRWNCTPEGIDFAVNQEIIPDSENGRWCLSDIHEAERETFDPAGLADRMAKLAAYKNTLPPDDYRELARDTLQSIVAEFAGKPFFNDALNLYRDATEGAVFYE